MKTKLSINQFLSVLIVLVMLLVQFAPIVKAQENTTCSHEWEWVSQDLHACDKCGETENHNWDANGKCKVCNATCSHSFSTVTGKCSICGMSKPIVIEEDDEDIECIHEWEGMTNQVHVCDNCEKAENHNWNSEGRCTVCGAACGHSFSTITGKCSICGISKTDEGENALIISTEAELRAFAEDVNNGNTYEGKVVCLTKSIELTSRHWTPIGREAHKFKGTFDGQGYTICGLKCSSKIKEDPNYGLFGYIEDAKILNVVLEDVNIELPKCNSVGGLVGCADMSSIINCSVSGIVEGHNGVGGIVGSAINSNYEMKSNIKNCSFEWGFVFGDYNLGGIVGYLSIGNVINCRVHDSDLAGYNDSPCNVGGVIGFLDLKQQVNSKIIIDNCCFGAGSIYGNENVGGVLGSFSDAYGDCEFSLSNLTCDSGSFVTGNMCVGGIAGHMLFLPFLPLQFGNCVNGAEVTGDNWVAGIVGLYTGSVEYQNALYGLKNEGTVIARKWDMDRNGVIDESDVNALKTEINKHDGEIITGTERYSFLDMNYDSKINERDWNDAKDNIINKYLHNLPSRVKHNQILNYDSNTDVFDAGVINSEEAQGAISEICGFQEGIKYEYVDKINDIDIVYEVSTTDNKTILNKGDKITVVATFDGYLSNKNTEMEALSEANKPKLYLADGIEMTVENVKYASSLDYNKDGSVNMEDITYAQNVNAGVIIDTNKERFTNEEILTVQKYLAGLNNKQIRTTIIKYTYTVPENTGFEVEKLKIVFPEKIYVAQDTGEQWPEMAKNSYKETLVIEKIAVDSVLPEIDNSKTKLYFREGFTEIENGEVLTGDYVYARIYVSKDLKKTPKLQILFSGNADKIYDMECMGQLEETNGNSIAYRYKVKDGNSGTFYVYYNDTIIDFNGRETRVEGGKWSQSEGKTISVNLPRLAVSMKKYDEEANKLTLTIAAQRGTGFEKLNPDDRKLENITITGAEVPQEAGYGLKSGADRYKWDLVVRPNADVTNVTIKINDNTIRIDGKDKVYFKGVEQRINLGITRVLDNDIKIYVKDGENKRVTANAVTNSYVYVDIPATGEFTAKAQIAFGTQSGGLKDMEFVEAKEVEGKYVATYKYKVTANDTGYASIYYSGKTAEIDGIQYEISGTKNSYEKEVSGIYANKPEEPAEPSEISIASSIDRSGNTTMVTFRIFFSNGVADEEVTADKFTVTGGSIYNLYKGPGSRWMLEVNAEEGAKNVSVKIADNVFHDGTGYYPGVEYIKNIAPVEVEAKSYFKENDTIKETGKVETDNYIYVELSTTEANLKDCAEYLHILLDFDKEAYDLEGGTLGLGRNLYKMEFVDVKEVEGKYVATYKYKVTEENQGLVSIYDINSAELRINYDNIKEIYANDDVVNSEPGISIAQKKYIPEENVAEFIVVCDKIPNHEDVTLENIQITGGKPQGENSKTNVEIKGLGIYRLTVEPEDGATSVTVKMADNKIRINGKEDFLKGAEAELSIDSRATQISSLVIEIPGEDNKRYFKEGDYVTFKVVYDEEIEFVDEEKDQKLIIKIGERTIELKNPEITNLNTTSPALNCESYMYKVGAGDFAASFGTGKNFEIVGLKGIIKDKTGNKLDKKDITLETLQGLDIEFIKSTNGGQASAVVIDGVKPECTIELQDAIATSSEQTEETEETQNSYYKTASKNLVYELIFSEPVKGLTEDNIVLENAEVKELTPDAVEKDGKYIYTLTATASETTVTLTVKDVEDLAGNKMSESTKEVVVEENETVVEDGTLIDIQKGAKIVSPKTAQDLQGITVAIKNAVKAVDSTKTDSDIKVKVFEEDGTTSTEGNELATGMVMKVQVGEGQEQEYISVVRGDLNGDGKVKAGDSTLLKLYILEKEEVGKELQGAYKKAADINQNGNIKPGDFISIILYLLDKTEDL